MKDSISTAKSWRNCVVERREQQGIGLDRVQVVHIQPLQREIAHEARCARIGQHPPGLRFENFRLLQFAFGGNFQQGRHRDPDSRGRTTGAMRVPDRSTGNAPVLPCILFAGVRIAR